MVFCVSNGFSTVLEADDVDWNLRDIAWGGIRCAQRRHGVAPCRVRNDEVVLSEVSDARILRAADERTERIFEFVDVFTDTIGTGEVVVSLVVSLAVDVSLLEVQRRKISASSSDQLRHPSPALIINS